MTEKEIFFEAIEKSSAEERAAYLDGACAKDVVLRRKVEALIQEHFTADSLLQGPAIDEAPTGASTPTGRTMVCLWKLGNQTHGLGTPQ